jgi:putative membrane protein
LITFCVAALLFPLRVNSILKILLATILTVLIDVLIEPVAMKLDFWNWENNTIPFQNYLGWTIISFLIFSFYSIVKLPLKNKIAIFLLIWQIVFFATLNLFLIGKHFNKKKPINAIGFFIFVKRKFESIDLVAAIQNTP